MIDTTNWQACTCDTCKAMCKRRPCWGTPQDVQALIEAGHGPRLMLDWWAVEGSDAWSDILILAPAIQGNESQGAPWWPVGRCTFLTDDGLCELHESGLKPTEGKLATHDESKSMVNLHEAVAQSWDSDEGRALVGMWKLFTGGDA